MKRLIIFAIMFSLLLASCAKEESVNFTPLPSGADEFFNDGIMDGALYVYVTKSGEVFIIRRDLRQYAWISLSQLREQVRFAESKGGYLVYTLEDGNLADKRADRACRVLVDCKLNSQDPIKVHPLVAKTRSQE